MAELHRRLASRKGRRVCRGNEHCLLPSRLAKIAQAEEMAVLAVVLVMVLCFKMTGALQAVVVDVDRLVVDMH